MTAASYEAVFRLLFLLSAEHIVEGNDGAETGWMIFQAHLDDSGRASPVAGAGEDARLRGKLAYLFMLNRAQAAALGWRRASVLGKA